MTRVVSRWNRWKKCHSQVGLIYRTEPRSGKKENENKNRHAHRSIGKESGEVSPGEEEDEEESYDGKDLQKMDVLSLE